MLMLGAGDRDERDPLTIGMAWNVIGCQVGAGGGQQRFRLAGFPLPWVVLLCAELAVLRTSRFEDNDR